MDLYAYLYLDMDILWVPLGYLVRDIYTNSTDMNTNLTISTCKLK